MKFSKESINAMSTRIDGILRTASEPLGVTFLTIVTNNNPALVKQALDKLQQRRMAERVNGGWVAIHDLQKDSRNIAPAQKTRATGPKPKAKPKVLKFKRKEQQKQLPLEVQMLVDALPNYQLEVSCECEPCTSARKFLNGSGIKPPAIVTVGEGNKSHKFYWGREGLFDYWFFVKAPFSFSEVQRFLDQEGNS